MLLGLILISSTINLYAFLKYSRASLCLSDYYHDYLKANWLDLVCSSQGSVFKPSCLFIITRSSYQIKNSYKDYLCRKYIDLDGYRKDVNR